MTTDVLPTHGPLGAALRSEVMADRELRTYCETGQVDALERARGAAISLLANLERELAHPSIRQTGDRK